MSGHEQALIPEVVDMTPATVSPMQLISAAVASGAGIDTIERLVALQERMAAKSAQQSFAAAMSRCQARMGRISADATNPQTKSKYASYAKLDHEIRPIYTEEGFALSFDTGTGEAETVNVLCHVFHRDGHSRTYSVTMPSDGKGAKGGDVMTKTHATGAAMSYGMRYLLKLIFNVAVGEDDRDGNQVPDMPEATFQKYLKAIREAETMDALQEVYTTAYRAAGKDKETCAAFIKAKDARKAELRGAK